MVSAAVGRAKIMARMVRAHAELRGITTALLMYGQNNDDLLPPTRFSCSSRTAYDLPIELGEQDYLPMMHRDGLDYVDFPDVFQPTQSYRYRAVGPAVMNETTVVENASSLWVPLDAPTCTTRAGRYWSDPRTSPVRYAVWSMGPDLRSPKFEDIPGRQPLPSRFWMHDAGDTGVITHFLDIEGTIHASP